MRVLAVTSLIAAALCGGCAGGGETAESTGCPPEIVATSPSPITCGRTGWPSGGVVTNRYTNGPHVELWGPPNYNTTPTARP